ncbi:hypothetical protein C0995_015961 [Termitomyces sp. Mi166|nr:hypothetical protein C0995_015961 [Termitomyces sp. Mi166\
MVVLIDFGGRAKLGPIFGGYSSQDENGHGTHVAGIIASDRYGVAKKARIISVKVMGGEPVSGYMSDFISGLEYVYKSAQRSNKQGRRSVVNISMNSPGRLKPVSDALAKIKNDVVLVVAAGNNAQALKNFSPANSPDVITVASSNISDQQVSLSNWGKGVDIFAPGEKITSLGFWNPNSYAITSGTSMAAAHVSGLAATFLTSHKYTTAQMRNKLIKYALKGVLSDIYDRMLVISYNCHLS